MTNTIETKTTRLAGLPQSADFNTLVNLLSVYSEAENRLERLQADINTAALEVVDKHKKEFAGLQKVMTETEAALEIIARRHADWFSARKSLKTPYGEVSLRTNPPRLVTDNEELAIVLIETEAGKSKGFNAAHYLRQRTELNLEALAHLTDDELARFRIKRIQGDTFNVKSAQLDLGKAVQRQTLPRVADASRN